MSLYYNPPKFYCVFIRSNEALINSGPSQIDDFLRKQSGRHDEDSLESSAIKMAKMFEVTSEKSIGFGCYCSGQDWRVLGRKTRIGTWADHLRLINALAPIIQTSRPCGSFKKEISLGFIPDSGVGD